MGEEDVRIVQVLYRECPLTVDDLPYTPEFDRLHAAFEGETVRGLDRCGLRGGGVDVLDFNASTSYPNPAFEILEV